MITTILGFADADCADAATVPPTSIVEASINVLRILLFMSFPLCSISLDARPLKGRVWSAGGGRK
jgi:hypothetical protein